MESNEVRALVEAFKGYRDLLSPIQVSLADFIETYDAMKDDIEKLNTAFSGDVKGNLEKIYKNLSSQAEHATDLSSRIDQFAKMTNKYTDEVTKLVAIFEKVGDRIAVVNDLEVKAETQIGKLDAILEEKRKNYNVKELQKTLESYNDNVQRVSEFINKDVAESMSQNYRKLESVKSVSDTLGKKVDDNSRSVEKLLEEFSTTSGFLKKISEKEDVNEEYLFDVLDRWAASRKVKTRK